LVVTLAGSKAPDIVAMYHEITAFFWNGVPSLSSGSVEVGVIHFL